jgi:hypothetical protein
MRFTTDHCLHCSTPGQPKETFRGTPYWFCNDECYTEACNKYVPKEWQGPYPDHPEFQERLANEPNLPDYMDDTLVAFKQLSARWYATQGEQYYKASQKIESRLRAQMEHDQRENEKKDRIAQEKEDEKQRKLDEKREAEEEEERLAKEAEAAKLEPRDIPPELRLEHTLLLAPSGQGKTQTLLNMILREYLDDNDNYTSDTPAIVLIDPKGFAVETLRRNAILSDYYARTVVIDPFDHPAIGLFQTSDRNPAQLISDIAYIFSTTDQNLTGKQAPCFSFCATLLFKIQNANLFTLLDLLDDRTDKKPPNPIFIEAIKTLPEVPRRFFQTDYYSSNYAATREQIKSRVWGVLQNDHLTVMLNAKTRKLDLVEHIRRRNLVLVNTRMVDLKEAHQTFGRYIISLVQDAIQAKKHKHPVYLIIDEFQEFADEIFTPRMLRLIREYGGGVTMAFQNMFCVELNDNTRNGIVTNTSIKYAATPEGADAPYLAKSMRCTPDFLQSVHKSKTHGHFACFVRNLTPPLKHPFIHTEKFLWANEWPQITEKEHKALKARNKAALADTRTAPVKSAASVPAPGEVRPRTPAKDETVEGDKLIITPESDPSRPAPWRRT